ncbi:hypothetical protein LPJ63_004725 [Coemansia sp. RSA 2711]|nr:hypothetical protein LPJ63_004725 [Coemansia sp. RSA 2711]
MTYVLRYFDGIGIAEALRLLLTAAGAEWTEEHPEWPLEKHNQPHGRMPVLIEKSGNGSVDFVICESGCIERYLSRKYGFLPADLKQAAHQEQLRDLIHDVNYALAGRITCKCEKDKEESNAKFKVLLDKVIDEQSRLIKDNGSTGRMFGEQLSYADIASYGFYKNLIQSAAQVLPDVADIVKHKLTPEVIKLISTVETDPLVKKHTSKGESLSAMATA